MGAAAEVFGHVLVLVATWAKGLLPGHLFLKGQLP